MNDTTNTDVLKYILEIESLLILLKKQLIPDLKESLSIEKQQITFTNTSFSNSSLYNVFDEISETVDYYINNIGFPNVGKKITKDKMKFKTIKFFEKYSLNSFMVLKILNTLEFQNNITYDKFLEKIEDTIIKKGKREKA